VQGVRHRIPSACHGVALDAVVVMPDHVHGLVHVDADPDGAESPATVGEVVRWFQGAATSAGFVAAGSTRQGQLTRSTPVG
jgi:hypothetical protein